MVETEEILDGALNVVESQLNAEYEVYLTQN
jgi:hypothetical protein